MYMQIEDEFGDVVGKARRGQELSTREVAAKVGLSEVELQRLEAYELTPPPRVVDRLAQVLSLHPGKLRISAEKRYFPLYPAGRPAPGISVEMVILGTDFMANGYVVGCAETRRGVVVDPGFEAEKILKAVDAMELEVEAVLLTHGHGDHVGALSEVCQATGAPALIGEPHLELLGDLRTKVEGVLVPGQQIGLGNQALEVRATPGHTGGSTCFVHPKAAFVGDALFAGSLGGTRRREDYEGQRASVEEILLNLDERGTIYPGHGPATTVAEEKANNPFFVQDF